MDIRIINREKEIINVSKLSIMARDKWLIGVNEKKETITIEEYKDKEEAERALIKIGKEIESRHKRIIKRDVIIHT